jgi:ATP-dependent RNA helicase DDX20
MPRVAVHGHDLADLTVARTADVALPEADAAATFGSLLLDEAVLSGLHRAGFVTPSPIQLKAIPLGRCGVDLVGQAKSGTGKTVVFSVIALEALTPSSPTLQVLALAPTREVATQIHHVITSIGAKTAAQVSLFIGGIPLPSTAPTCHIAIGTPGRVREMLRRGLLPAAGIRLLILDEVDKLLSVGFRDQVDAVFDFLPLRKQVVALSATYPRALADTLGQYMRDPVHVRLDSEAPSLRGVTQYYVVAGTDTPIDPAAVTAPAVSVPRSVHMAKASALVDLLQQLTFRQCVVFCNLRSRAQKLSAALCNAGFPAGFITGTLEQKDRSHVMRQFRQFELRVLVSTDLTARGVDVERVNLVINVDIPSDGETYLHRIGRTGRFGTLGLAVTIVTKTEEATFLALLRRCNTSADTLPSVVDPDRAVVVADHKVVTTAASGTERKTAGRGKHSLAWCKWEQGEYASEGCWAHRDGRCPDLHRDEADLMGTGTTDVPNVVASGIVSESEVDMAEIKSIETEPAHLPTQANTSAGVSQQNNWDHLPSGNYFVDDGHVLPELSTAQTSWRNHWMSMSVGHWEQSCVAFYGR